MTQAFTHYCAALLFFVLVPAAHAGTIYVANNGVDSGSCGAQASPCRSITQGIKNAGVGDHIIVGPGGYKGETGAPGCDCFVAVNKSVILTSSDGAASTVIDATSFLVLRNVLITADGSEFGRPGKGFTVTNPDAALGDRIESGAKDVKVRGNQVVADAAVTFPGTGILTVAGNPGPMLIEGNQVMLWNEGILALGAGKVSKNQVSLNFSGIGLSGSSSATGNVVSGNISGIDLGGMASAVGNAVYGNFFGITVISPFSGTIADNNIAGTGAGGGNCGLRNEGVAGLVAANNYWGAPTGPGPDPADGVCNNGGTTTTAPFATTPFKVKAPIKP